MTFDVKSGPHPHSQSGSGEVREVQFEIQRPCPSWPEWHARHLLSRRLPIAIWVYYPAIARTDHQCDVFPYVYRLTPSGRKIIEELFGTVTPRACVCQCLGRIIE